MGVRQTAAGAGVAANATERVVRGVSRPQNTDSIYRAMRGSDSSTRRLLEVANARRAGVVARGSDAENLKATRRTVLEGWSAVARALALQNEGLLAEEVRKFAIKMPPPLNEREFLVSHIPATKNHLFVHRDNDLQQVR